MTSLRPDSALLKYWRWHWAVWTIIVCVPQFILALGLPNPGSLILGISCGICVLIAIALRLYIPLYFDTLTYTIENDLVVGTRGVLWKKRVTVPFRKITNIDISQGPVQRMFDLGTIHVQTAGTAGPQGAMAELRIEGMKQFDALRDEILQLLRSFFQTPASGSVSPAPEAQPAGPGTPGADMQAVVEELRAIRALLEKQS